MKKYIKNSIKPNICQVPFCNVLKTNKLYFGKNPAGKSANCSKIQVVL